MDILKLCIKTTLFLFLVLAVTFVFAKPASAFDMIPCPIRPIVEGVFTINDTGGDASNDPAHWTVTILPPKYAGGPETVFVQPNGEYVLECPLVLEASDREIELYGLPLFGGSYLLVRPLATSTAKAAITAIGAITETMDINRTILQRVDADAVNMGTDSIALAIERGDAIQFGAYNSYLGVDAGEKVNLSYIDARGGGLYGGNQNGVRYGMYGGGLYGGMYGGKVLNVQDIPGTAVEIAANDIAIDTINSGQAGPNDAIAVDVDKGLTGIDLMHVSDSFSNIGLKSAATDIIVRKSIFSLGLGTTAISIPAYQDVPAPTATFESVKVVDSTIGVAVEAWQGATLNFQDRVISDMRLWKSLANITFIGEEGLNSAKISYDASIGPLPSALGDAKALYFDKEASMMSDITYRTTDRGDPLMAMLTDAAITTDRDAGAELEYAVVEMVGSDILAKKMDAVTGAQIATVDANFTDLGTVTADMVPAVKSVMNYHLEKKAEQDIAKKVIAADDGLGNYELDFVTTKGLDVATYKEVAEMDTAILADEIDRKALTDAYTSIAKGFDEVLSKDAIAIPQFIELRLASEYTSPLKAEAKMISDGGLETRHLAVKEVVTAVEIQKEFQKVAAKVVTKKSIKDGETLVLSKEALTTKVAVEDQLQIEKAQLIYDDPIAKEQLSDISSPTHETYMKATLEKIADETLLAIKFVARTEDGVAKEYSYAEVNGNPANKVILEGLDPEVGAVFLKEKIDEFATPKIDILISCKQAELACANDTVFLLVNLACYKDGGTEAECAVDETTGGVVAYDGRGKEELQATVKADQPLVGEKVKYFVSSGGKHHMVIVWHDKLAPEVVNITFKK